MFLKKAAEHLALGMGLILGMYLACLLSLWCADTLGLLSHKYVPLFFACIPVFLAIGSQWASRVTKGIHQGAAGFAVTCHLTFVGDAVAENLPNGDSLFEFVLLGLPLLVAISAFFVWRRLDRPYFATGMVSGELYGLGLFVASALGGFNAI